MTSAVITFVTLAAGKVWALPELARRPRPETPTAAETRDRQRSAEAAPHGHVSPSPRNGRATRVGEPEKAVDRQDAGGEHDEVGAERKARDIEKAMSGQRDADDQEENRVEDERKQAPETV